MLKLKYDELLSKIAFNLNLRRYPEVVYHRFIEQALPMLVPMLLETLTKQDEDQVRDRARIRNWVSSGSCPAVQFCGRILSIFGRVGGVFGFFWGFSGARKRARAWIRSGSSRIRTDSPDPALIRALVRDTGTNRGGGALNLGGSSQTASHNPHKPSLTPAQHPNHNHRTDPGGGRRGRLEPGHGGRDLPGARGHLHAGRCGRTVQVDPMKPKLEPLEGKV